MNRNHSGRDKSRRQRDGDDIQAGIMSFEARVRSIIVESVRMIGPDSTAHAAARIMLEHNIGCLVVAGNDGPIGFVTERDILRKVTAQGVDPTKAEIRDIMSSPLVVISPDASIGEAARKMVDNDVKRLVVTDEDGKFMGLVTMSDIVGWVAKQEKVTDSLMNYLMNGEL